MKDKVFMSPQNGALAVGVPLFRLVNDSMIDNQDGYCVAITVKSPIAYVLDIGDECQLFSAEWVEKHLIDLGEL